MKNWLKGIRLNPIVLIFWPFCFVVLTYTIYKPLSVKINKAYTIGGIYDFTDEAMHRFCTIKYFYLVNEKVYWASHDLKQESCSPYQLGDQFYVKYSSNNIGLSYLLLDRKCKKNNIVIDSILNEITQGN